MHKDFNFAGQSFRIAFSCAHAQEGSQAEALPCVVYYRADIVFALARHNSKCVCVFPVWANTRFAPACRYKQNNQKLNLREKDMSDKNVMVVEDNEKNRKLMRVVLKAKGYNVIEATTGEEALSILKDQRPNIILMDIQLPGIDGITLTRQIKADTATKDIPIIAVTAYAMKGDEQKILDSGCDAYISKPINTQELPSLVEKYIKKT